jgi:hypothetical protein
MALRERLNEPADRQLVGAKLNLPDRGRISAVDPKRKQRDWGIREITNAFAAHQ